MLTQYAEDDARQARAVQTMTFSGLATQTQTDGAARCKYAERNTTTKPTLGRMGWGGAGSLA
eukprot:584355-Rhodomonas_salina.1